VKRSWFIGQLTNQCSSGPPCRSEACGGVGVHLLYNEAFAKTLLFKRGLFIKARVYTLLSLHCISSMNLTEALLVAATNVKRALTNFLDTVLNRLLLDHRSLVFN